MDIEEDSKRLSLASGFEDVRAASNELYSGFAAAYRLADAWPDDDDDDNDDNNDKDVVFLARDADQKSDSDDDADESLLPLPPPPRASAPDPDTTGPATANDDSALNVYDDSGADQDIAELAQHLSKCKLNNSDISREYEQLFIDVEAAKTAMQEQKADAPLNRIDVVRMAVINSLANTTSRVRVVDSTICDAALINFTGSISASVLNSLLLGHPAIDVGNSRFWAASRQLRVAWRDAKEQYQQQQQQQHTPTQTASSSRARKRHAAADIGADAERADLGADLATGVLDVLQDRLNRIMRTAATGAEFSRVVRTAQNICLVAFDFEQITLATIDQLRDAAYAARVFTHDIQVSLPEIDAKGDQQMWSCFISFNTSESALKRAQAAPPASTCLPLQPRVTTARTATTSNQSAPRHNRRRRRAQPHTNNPPPLLLSRPATDAAAAVQLHDVEAIQPQEHQHDPAAQQQQDNQGAQAIELEHD